MTGSTNNPWDNGTFIDVESLTEVPPFEELKEIAGEPPILEGGEDPLEQSEIITEEVVGDLEEPEQPEEETLFFYLTAQKLKEEGLVNFDEIPKDITPEIVYDNYKDTNYGKLKEEVLNEANNQLQSAGITEENIALLHAIQNGVPTDDISVINRFKSYTKLDKEDLAEEKKLDVIKEMYVIRGLKDKEIERQLSSIEIGGEVDAELEEAKQFFGEFVGKFEAEQAEITKQRLAYEHQMRTKNQGILERAIKVGEIGTDKITKEQQEELKRAFHERTVELEQDGQKHYLTPYEEFLYKFNNDFEYQLSVFKNVKFKDKEIEKVKKEVIKKENASHWDALKTAQGKSVQRQSIKKGNEIENIIPGNGRYFEYEIIK